MGSVRESSKLHLILFVTVITLAFAIRFRGMWFGYPLPLHPDEPFLVGRALTMVRTGDLNPHFFNYPSLNIYLQALLYRLTALGSQFLINESMDEIPEIRFYIVGRFFSLLQAVGTIIVTYEIGRRLLSSLAGLAAAVFVTFSVLHLRNSFIITVDSPAAFWSVLATLMAVLIYTRGKRLHYYVLGGMFVGLAISSKYTAAVSFAPILLAHLRLSWDDRHWLDRNILAGLLMVPVAFIVTTPYAVLDHNKFLAALRFESNHYRTGHPGAESAGSTSYLNYGRYLLTEGYGLLPLILSGLGLLWLLRKEPFRAFLLLATPLLLFLFVGRYKVYFSRNIVTLIPYLALFGGYFVASAYEWLVTQARRRTSGDALPASAGPLIAAALVGVLVLISIRPQVDRGLAYVRSITLPDTRWESIVWLRQNLPTGSRIGREHYTPPVEDFTDQFQVSALDYYAVVRKPDEVVDLDYMIVSAADYGRFFTDPDQYPAEHAAYEVFFRENELIHEFIPDGVTLAGPRLRVYKINPPSAEP